MSRRAIVAGCAGIGIVVAGGVGYALAGSVGAVTVAAAVGLAGTIVTILVWGIKAVVHAPTPTNRRTIAGGSGMVALLLLGSYYGGAGLSDGGRALLIAGGTIVVGVLAGYRSDTNVATGLVNGSVIGGGAGVVFVFIAAQQSFRTSPALTIIVLLSGVVAPLVLGVLCGLGGGVGSGLRARRRAAE